MSTDQRPGPMADQHVEQFTGRDRFEDTTFASSSVRVHLLRGVIGIPLLVAAFALIGLVGPWSLLLALPAGVLLRGCPTCWALGLAQTRACALRRTSSGG